MKREEIFQYVKEQYGTEPEYLWKKDPDSAVLRHKNGKWYAIIMAVEKKTLGLEEDGKINILDVKCDPDLVGMIIQTHGFLPGYHMNKRHWITILLDEPTNGLDPLGIEELRELIRSFPCKGITVILSSHIPVSYTHLDVYKRQI